MPPPENPPESSFKTDEEGDRYIELYGKRIYYDKNMWTYFKDEHNNLYSYKDANKIYWFIWNPEYPKIVERSIEIEQPTEAKAMPPPTIITPDIYKDDIPLQSKYDVRTTYKTPTPTTVTQHEVRTVNIPSTSQQTQEQATEAEKANR